jgi:3-deoxy-manno-octulosonate cytidylyltransferase (CMP-KDO synthetase)
MKAIGLIPVRLESKRLPGKALLDLDGLPMIIHTAKRALLAKELDQVYVCTDSNKIINVCKKFKVKFIKTKSNFKNGTERIASIVKRFHNNLIIDIQGDEPLFDPKYIDKLVNIHKKHKENPEIIIPTIETNFESNHSIIRVLSNKKGRIMYLSRAKIPFQFSSNVYLISKHVSIISFTSKALVKYSKLKMSYYESVEGIELLRAIENDMKVYSTKLNGETFSVDVNDDYLRAKVAMKSDPIRKLY